MRSGVNHYEQIRHTDNFLCNIFLSTLLYAGACQQCFYRAEIFDGFNTHSYSAGKDGGGMILTDKQRAEFLELSRPMMEWLNNNFHPHVDVIISPVDARLLEGVSSTGHIYDYVKD